MEAATVHAAMEAASGNIREAAKALGTTSLALRDIIQKNEGLRTRWRIAGVKGTGAPGVEATIHRPPAPTLPKTITVAGEVIEEDEARKIAKAAADEDAAVRSGLLNMGVRGKGLEMVLAMQQVQRKHFARCIEILGGGITKQAIDIMVEVEAISDKLNTPGMTLEEQMMLREDRRGLLDILGKYKDKVDKSALIQAMVKKVEAEAKAGGKNRPGKPGFGVLVQGEKVEIHEHNSPAE